jgi:hypothetical protein
MRNKNLDWLRFKATELENLASNSPVTVERTNRWHSMCYPLFNEFRIMFYNDQKRQLNSDSLNSLRDIALAVWYGDSGTYTKDQVVMNTHVWGEDGTEKIKQYFECLDYKPIIFQERGNFRIALDHRSSIEFLRMVAPYLPMK